MNTTNRNMLPADTELEAIYAISRIATQSENWRTMLDNVIPVLRPAFIFDNLALYLADDNSVQLEAAFARVIGRGKSAEGEISWGEVMAGQVYSQNKLILQQPETQVGERLDAPYLLGVPVQIHGNAVGALTFARFGGPDYTHGNTRIATFVAEMLAANLSVQTDAELRQQLDNERQQVQLQEDFVSTITHELLTPLGFIKGYATTLLRADTSWDAAIQKELLTIIEQESDRLQDLIDNLLDSARLKSGALSMEFQPVRVDALIKDVVTRARVQQRNLQTRFHFAAPLKPIDGDPRRLSQVVENLINNALKYAPGAPIDISVIPEDHDMHLIFHDGGPGIPQHYLPHLFDRFYRAPDQAPNIRGTGLGLYICHQIVEQHHGKITVESEVGEGTTFHVFLPYQQKSSIRLPEEMQEGKPL